MWGVSLGRDKNTPIPDLCSWSLDTFSILPCFSHGPRLAGLLSPSCWTQFPLKLCTHTHPPPKGQEYRKAQISWLSANTLTLQRRGMDPTADGPQGWGSVPLGVQSIGVPLSLHSTPPALPAPAPSTGRSRGPGDGWACGAGAHHTGSRNGRPWALGINPED